MGLHTTHNCWTGSCSSFNQWRSAVARAAGYEGDLREDVYFGSAPMPFEPDDPIRILLDHSDCEGDIQAMGCTPLADRLEALIPELERLYPNIPSWWSHATNAHQFVAGLRYAASRGENVEFH